MVLCLDSLHRVVAEDVFAAEPLPPFAASIKDGYAVVGSIRSAVFMYINVVFFTFLVYKISIILPYHHHYCYIIHIHNISGLQELTRCFSIANHRLLRLCW